jgi:hypothetical protein
MLHHPNIWWVQVIKAPYVVFLPLPSWPQILSSAHTSPSMGAPCLTPIQDYSCLYFWIADCKTKILQWMTASIPWFKLLLFSSSIEFSFIKVFPQVSKLFHPFKGTTINVCVCRCTYVSVMSIMLITWLLMWQSLLFRHHFYYYPDVDSHYPWSQIIIYYHTKIVVIGNTLLYKNPVPSRGHLKCSGAGKILAQSCQMALRDVVTARYFLLLNVPILSLLPGTCY